MKKLIILALILATFMSFKTSAQAKALTAEMISEFDSTNPQTEFCAMLTKKTDWLGDKTLEKGCLIKGTIIEVVPPHKGKRNAYFIIIPTSYTVPSQNKLTKEISKNLKIKVKPYTPTSKAAVAGKVVTTAANTMVKGVGLGINFVTGAIKAQDGENRLKSGAMNVYDNSPLSYMKTGTNIFLKRGDIVKFSLDKEIFE